jgi:hypothetical protein
MRPTCRVLFVCAALIGASGVRANFINLGFEDATFQGWGQTGAKWQGGNQYSQLSNQGQSEIVGAGFDPYSNGQLSQVAYGNFAARVNNAEGGNCVSTLSQLGVWEADEFTIAWAAVLQAIGGPAAYRPRIKVRLTDLTAGDWPYHSAHYAENLADAKQGLTEAGVTWFYTDWNYITVDTSGRKGHLFNLEILGSDSGQGAYGGYLYVDSFVPTPPVSDAGSTMMLLGAALVAVGLIKRRVC